MKLLKASRVGIGANDVTRILILCERKRAKPHIQCHHGNMTDWEASYQQGETPWDRGEAAPALAEIVEKFPTLFKGRILVPGCGLGHDARWLAAQGCEVVGLDIAPTALKKARELDPTHRVEFTQTDLFDLPKILLGSFDIVWEHTCLSAMPPELRPRYAAAYKSALKPGGTIVGVFYLNPDMDPGETGPPFAISVEELTELWQSVGLELTESWVPINAYEGRAGRERVMVLHHHA